MLLNILFKDTEVTPKEEFDEELDRAAKAIGTTDPDDVPFIALVLHLDADVWSDDTDFDDQDAVET